MFNFFNRAWRWPMIVVALATTTGCATYAAAAPRPPRSPGSATAAPSVAPTTIVSPAMVPTAPSPVAPAAPTLPPAPPPAAPVAPAPSVLHFPLLAAAEPVGGEVIITPMGGSYRLQVEASGLPPGSVHSVHVHFGNCPSVGVHIAVLGTMVADSGGNASLGVTLGVPYRGNGRFVIVYVGPAAGPLAACAQLSG